MRPKIEAILGGSRNAICPDIDWQEYLDLPAMNPSTLVAGIKGADISPMHVKYEWEHPRKDTAALSWGRAVHCLLFEPREFTSRYAIFDGGSRRTKAYKDFLVESWDCEREVLLEEELEQVNTAVKRFVNEPLVQAMIAAGQSEVTLFCTEGEIQCRGRVDWISTAQHQLVDLKTTRNIAARPFGRDFVKFHYDVKLGLYQRWLQKLTGEPWPVWCICIENQPPYDITVVPVHDSILEHGANKGLKVLRAVELCCLSGEWTGIAGGREYYLDYPTYEMDEEMEEFTG